MEAAVLVGERTDILRGFTLWSSLSEELLTKIAEAMETIAYAPGEAIITQGQPGRHLSVLTAGSADVRIRTEAGGAVRVATLHVGDTFGEMALIGEDVTSADVVAAEECTTLALGREAFHDLVAEHPALLKEFVRLLSRRLKASDVATGVARQKEEDLTRFLQEQKSEQYSTMIGSAKPIKELQRQIEAKSGLQTPLLIAGEKGVGKELVARLVHFRGPRKDAPLVSVECGQITESQWGDQLFGLYDQGTAPEARGMSYVALAQSGTLLLKNVTALPPAIQDRLVRFLGGDAVARGVRVIATSRVNLLEEAAAGRFSTDLAAILLGDVIEVPPLRDHKRDIPELAAHFVKKHAQRLGKKIGGLDDQAMIRLVSYDYHFANAQELEESIERAVIITDGEVISEEAIFLGLPPRERPMGFNLLALPRPMVNLVLRLFPTPVRVISVLFFAFILYQCFFVPARTYGNIGTILVWAVWWPALALSFFFAGRAWCAICPMATAGEMAQKVASRTPRTERRIPAVLKEYDVSIVMAGFFLIVWAEEVTHMRQSPVATGFLLVTIISGALVTSALFPRRTWCRHLCPMGGFAGLCSTSALLELRPTPDICSAKCKGHSCYKGDGNVAGCPMFQHVMFVDSNRDCVMCLNCVRLCPNGSPQLNLRVPGRELWSGISARPQVGMLVSLLLGLLLGQAVIQLWEHGAGARVQALLADHRVAFVSVLLVACAAVPLAAVWALGKRRAAEPVAATLHWQRVTSWAPLLGGGYAAYQLANIPGFHRLEMALGGVAVEGLPEPLLSVAILPAIQVLIVALSLAFTIATLWKIWPAGERASGVMWVRGQAVAVGAAVLYAAILLSVMVVRPAWMAI